LHGVGEKLANKVWEIIESGDLQKLNELSSTEEMQAISLFTNIWGVGATTARGWVFYYHFHACLLSVCLVRNIVTVFWYSA